MQLYRAALWGIALLKQNVYLIAEDGNLWDSLGEVYFLTKDKGNSIKSFLKAIEIKTKTDCYWCKNATKRLQ